MKRGEPSAYHRHFAPPPGAMVIKSDLCVYTEYRIYPGRGKRFVAKDGKVTFYINQKAFSLNRQKIKPVKLTWTQAWRRMNKKGKVEKGKARKGRKSTKFQKAIVGMTLDDIKRKRAQKPELRQAAKEAAMKEAKERMAKQGAVSKSGGSSSAKAKAAPSGGGSKKDAPQKSKGGKAPGGMK